MGEKEWKQIDAQAKSLKTVFVEAEQTEVYDEPKRLGIYYACLYEALHNDERSNREGKSPMKSVEY